MPELYSDILLDHFRHPRNYGSLAARLLGGHGAAVGDVGDLGVGTLLQQLRGDVAEHRVGHRRHGA